jgi:toxin-antitoxin system PIN domain toxin
VILVDTNLLLYASFDNFARHARARAWMAHQLSSGTRVGLSWYALLGFVRVSSQRSVVPRGPTVAEAWQLARGWLANPNVWVPLPSDRHGEILDRLLTSGNVGHGLVMDIHLAALAIEHGLMLCSADNDFARFPDVRWLNPLDA